MKLNIQMIGTANVLKNISYWQKVKFRKEIRDALDRARLETENAAIRFCPKDTGALKASMWSKMVSDTEAQIGDGLYYGVFQEKGTKNFAPQPFLMPGFEIGKKVFEKEMKEVLK